MSPFLSGYGDTGIWNSYLRAYDNPHGM